MSMCWRDLLFAHWVADAAVLRGLIPKQLDLDLFEGRAHVGAVPFRMEGVKPRGFPAVHGLHSFPELNLRTYVTYGGKPGVWFFSLDAGQKLAVRVARRFFHLAYFDAKFKISFDGNGKVDYSSKRTHRGAAMAEFSASYSPVGEPYAAKSGSLDAWLTDRYCLYAADPAGRLFRGNIDHDRWPLQHAEVDVRINTLGNWLGIEMKGAPQTSRFAKSLDVRAWLVERL